MKLIRYAGAELLTGDEIALAVLEYCAALAEETAAETIDIPIVSAKGEIVTATILVGPASQIVAEDVTSEYPELVDERAVALLQARTRAHRPIARNAQPRDDSTPSDDWPEII